MTGELIIFPVRAYVRVARFAVRSGVAVTSRALALTAHVIRSVTPSGSDEAPPPAVAERETTAERAYAAAVDDALAAPPPEPEAPAEQRRTVAPPPEVTPLTAEPVHVSEEPAVVEEFAEPGAEDGAGAEVTVSEPWEGYEAMAAPDVVARLGDATPAELAAVQLYETSHRQRATVIAAVERELRAKSASRAPAADHTRKEPDDG